MATECGCGDNGIVDELRDIASKVARGYYVISTADVMRHAADRIECLERLVVEPPQPGHDDTEAMRTIARNLVQGTTLHRSATNKVAAYLWWSANMIDWYRIRSNQEEPK